MKTIEIGRLDVRQFEKIVRSIISEELKKQVSVESQKVYTITKAAKILHIGYRTIKSKIDQGIIKTTLDGKITHQSLTEYLEGK